MAKDFISKLIAKIYPKSSFRFLIADVRFDFRGVKKFGRGTVFFDGMLVTNNSYIITFAKVQQ